MAGYKAEIVIDAPPERIFELVGNFDRHSDWAAHKLRIEPQSSGTPSVGAKFHSLGHQMGRDNPNDLTVIEVTPPRRFAFEAAGKEGRFRHAFDLEQRDESTHVTKSFEVLEASLPTTLLTPLFSIIGPKGLAGDLRRLKAKVEQA